MAASRETSGKQGQGNGTVPAGLAITIRKLTNFKAPFAPFCVETRAFVAPERPLLTQIVHRSETCAAPSRRECPKSTHKKSLQIPYTYGKLSLGVYVMAAVATVGSKERKGRRAASPPFIDCQPPLTHFLIANLPIRNRRNPSTINKISISNRQKNGIFPSLQSLTSRLEHPETNRNSQELKTDVTL